MALVEAAERGIVGWRITIEYLLDHRAADAESMAEARQLDGLRAAAIDAIGIVRDRYITAPADKGEQVELFEEGEG